MNIAQLMLCDKLERFTFGNQSILPPMILLKKKVVSISKEIALLKDTYQGNLGNYVFFANFTLYFARISTNAMYNLACLISLDM